jgi:hypothetical protein
MTRSYPEPLRVDVGGDGEVSFVTPPRSGAPGDLSNFQKKPKISFVRVLEILLNLKESALGGPILSYWVRRRKYKLGQTNRDFGSKICFGGPIPKSSGEVRG